LYGDKATIVDWQVLKRLLSTKEEAAKFIEQVGIPRQTENGPCDNFLVSMNGHLRLGNGFWLFLARHDGNVPNNWNVLDSIDNHTIDLGRWSWKSQALVAIPNDIGAPPPSLGSSAGDQTESANRAADEFTKRAHEAEAAASAFAQKAVNCGAGPHPGCSYIPDLECPAELKHRNEVWQLNIKSGGHLGAEMKAADRALNDCEKAVSAKRADEARKQADESRKRWEEENAKRQAEATKAELARREAERIANEKAAAALAEQQTANYEEAKQASGAPNFKVEVFANTFESHSHIIVPEHKEYTDPVCLSNGECNSASYILPPQFEESTSGHPASVQLTNLGSAIIVQKVTLNGRPECSMQLSEEGVVVKTGDVLSIVPLCASTVNVVIQTNRGTVNYKVQ
jgi:hypothetical protein